MNKGKWAEDIAEKYLRSKGYRVVCRNFRTKFGEIDIVATKGGVLAFVEVKYRAKSRDAWAAVTVGKARRIVKAANLFLSRNRRYAGLFVRFDTLGVYGDGEVVHVEGAFDPEEVGCTRRRYRRP